MTDALVRGDVRWADLDPLVGREQAGRRPVVVVASRRYLEVVTTLAVVVPVTGRDRGWRNHVRLQGPVDLTGQSWALTEQVRTVARERLRQPAGRVDAETLDEIDMWVRDFLDLPR